MILLLERRAHRALIIERWIHMGSFVKLKNMPAGLEWANGRQCQMVDLNAHAESVTVDLGYVDEYRLPVQIENVPRSQFTLVLD